MNRKTFVLALLLVLEHRAYGQVAPTKLPPVPTKTIPEVGGEIDANRAMLVAEQFVRANGYTDFMPSDLGKLQPEWIEMKDDREEWLRQRHNTVRPRAYGYRKGVRKSLDGWTVVFARTKPPGDDSNIGVGVRMDKSGNNIEFMHGGVDLNFYTRRLD